MKSLFRDKAKKESFKELYKNYYAPFCLYAKRYIHEKSIREDLVSDIFINLWTKKDTIDFTSETMLAYIKKGVKNSCLNYIKHQIHENNYKAEQVFTAPSYTQNSDHVFSRDELYEMLNKTLNKLPQNYRQVFEKTFFEGKKRTEIAEELNISIKSVERYKQKSLELIRKDLKDLSPIIIALLCL